MRSKTQDHLELRTELLYNGFQLPGFLQLLGVFHGAFETLRHRFAPLPASSTSISFPRQRCIPATTQA